MNEPRKLVIEESKWYRGQGSQHSRLRRTDGAMCCLGFDALACGLTEKQITRVAFPSSLGTEGTPAALPESMKWLTHLNDPQDDEELELERQIGGVNDDPDITDDVRKERLRPLFAKGNIELVFVP